MMDYTAWNEVTQNAYYYSGETDETLIIVLLTKIRSKHFLKTRLNHLPSAD
jgi:hypothetical protein